MICDAWRWKWAKTGNGIRLGHKAPKSVTLSRTGNEVVPQSSLQGNLLVKGATDLKTHHLTLHQSQYGAGKNKAIQGSGHSRDRRVL